MTDYNLFNHKMGVWHNVLPHTYAYAREVLEDLRKDGFTEYEVREMPDGTEAVGYNVWCNDPGRWTRNGYGKVPAQNDLDPVPLTFTQAEEVLSGVSHSMLPEIMEIGADLKPQPVFINPATPAVVAVAETTPVVEEKDPTPEIDWAAYHGFKGIRVYRMRDLQQDIDPYTGLRKEK